MLQKMIISHLIYSLTYRLLIIASQFAQISLIIYSYLILRPLIIDS